MKNAKEEKKRFFKVIPMAIACSQKANETFSTI